MSFSDGHVRWQCRRGMRELDELLMDYFERSYGTASEAEKGAFRELLALPDPLLASYLVTGQASAEGVSARVISRIRNHTRSRDSSS
jgi:antitoxin CptB